MKRIIYIVTWIISTHISIPCPEVNKTDKFGRESISASCDVLHGYWATENHYEIFTDHAKAESFYNEARMQSGYLGGYVYDDRIDSVQMDTSYAMLFALDDVQWDMDTPDMDSVSFIFFKHDTMYYIMDYDLPNKQMNFEVKLHGWHIDSITDDQILKWKK